MKSEEKSIQAISAQAHGDAPTTTMPGSSLT